jgi:deazaflavin-dependent oxidoreductase (nitroreductase family)
VDVDRIMSRLSPAVVWLLRSPLHPLASWGLILVTVTGVRTGRAYTIPVGYQRDGDGLTVLVSHASRKRWWRNYRERRPIEVHLRGRTLAAHASVVPPDSPAFQDAVARTFRRLPSLGRQFGIDVDRRTGITPEQARVVAGSGAVVHIELDPAGRDGVAVCARDETGTMR